MVKILSFRNKDDSAPSQEYLTDGNQTLSFRSTEDGRVDLGNLRQTDVHDLFADPRKDWSNQELADLFRVKQLLSSANVPVEIDRGITDEGDPWFVFCQASGEVFIHLCRIDGLYFLDSPNVLRPLRGESFDALIADFTNQALPPQEDDNEAELRVIRLERGGKVRLHPSAMLAALIWTLFIASEELVLLAPKDEAETDKDDLFSFDGMFTIENTEEVQVDLFLQKDKLDAEHFLIQANQETHYDVPEQGQIREALHQQGMSVQNNAFTIGLSTIAIAMGFMSETALLTDQHKVLEGLKELNFARYGTETSQTIEVADLPTQTENGDILAMLADFLGLDLSLGTDDTVQASADRQRDLTHLTKDAVLAEEDANTVKATAPLDVVENKDTLSAQEAQTKLSDEQADDAILAELVATEGTQAAEATQSASTSALDEITQAWQPLMEEFQLGGTTIKTSFDLSKTDSFALFDLLEFSGGRRTTNFQEFDQLAERIIDFLEAKDGELGIIELENEIIMVDLTAVTGGQTEFLNWETSDGKIVSLVGLASDFAQFDMIA